MPDAGWLKPRRVQRGSRVSIVAPASPFRVEELELGLAEIRRLGFEPVYDASLFDRTGYVAGTAESRARALRRAWCDDSTDAILAVRGGYGSVQVLPWLDPVEIRAARKAFVGYSDLTAILAYLGGACRVVALHGPTVAGRLERGAAGYDEATFVGALMEAGPLGVLTSPAVEPLVGGEAVGPLVGGNLTQLASSLGTPFAFDPPPGCVLFLEDVNERPYRLDRLWTQLRLAGIIGRAAALVLGEFPGCDEPDGGPTAREVLARLVREADVPTIVGVPAGHTVGPALTLPLGVTARVAAGPESALVIEEPATAP